MPPFKYLTVKLENWTCAQVAVVPDDKCHNEQLICTGSSHLNEKAHARIHD